MVDADDRTPEGLLAKNDGRAAERLAVENIQGQKLHPHAMPLRQYMDRNIVPTLLPALTALANERPENPTEWLAYYLLKNNPMNEQNKKSEGSNSK